MKHHEFNCPLCNGTDFKYHSITGDEREINTFDYVTCNNCQTVSTVVSETELEEADKERLKLQPAFLFNMKYVVFKNERIPIHPELLKILTCKNGYEFTSGKVVVEIMKMSEEFMNFRTLLLHPVIFDKIKQN